MRIFGRKFSVGNGAATNSIILIFVSFVTALLGIVITKLLSSNFSLEEYGTYSQVLLINTSVGSITLLGFNSAVNYFFNKSNDELLQKKYIATLFASETFFGVVSAALIILLRKQISIYFGNPAVEHSVIIVAFMPLLANLIKMYQTLFISIGKAKMIAVRNFVVSIIRLIAVVVASYITHNIITVVLVLLFLDVAQFFYFMILFGKYRFSFGITDVDIKIIKEILAFSIPLAIYTISGSLTNDMDKYVIGYFTDTETLAIYSNASKRLPFDILTTSFVTVLIPIITRLLHSKEYKDAKALFQMYLRFGCIASIVLGGGCIIFSEHIMTLLYDAKYLPGINVFRLYLVIEMIRFANTTIVLSATGQTKIMMFTSVCMLILNLIFNVISFYLFGWVGPAVTTLVLTTISTAVLLHYGAKTLNTSLGSLFNLSEMFVVALEVIAVGAAYLLVYGFIKKAVYLPEIATLGVVALYGLTLLIMNKKRVFGYIHSINKFR